MKPRKNGTIVPIISAALGLTSWIAIPWLYFSPPQILYGYPIALIGFGALLVGLILLCTAGVLVLSSLSARFDWARRALGLRGFLIAAMLLLVVGPYLLSPLAPNWKCATAPITISIARAQGQNCTQECTNWDSKPCGGWSSCFNKSISCSSSGKDQNGRNCQGCCFDCKVVCEQTDSPPTVSSSLSCDLNGNSGWCRSNARLTVSASDPQGYSVSISGSNPAFSCGSACTVNLPAGDATASYTATSSVSGLTASGSSTWKYDPNPPSISISVAGGSENASGWFSSPLALSATATDAISGVSAAVQASMDNGASWQSEPVDLSEGIQIVTWQVADLAGNVATIQRTFRIDTQSPTISVTTSGTAGNGGWFTAPVTLEVFASDNLSGITTTQYRINGSAWTDGSSVTLIDGIYTVDFQAFDMAGNLATASQSAPIEIDTTPPVVSIAASGSTGTGGWYVSSATLTAISSDVLSGVTSTQYRIDGGEWTDGNSVTLAEGVFAVDFFVFDAAGNSTQVSQTVSVDTVSPELTHSIAGTVGNVPWYISSTVVTAAASDLTSGIETIEYRFDSGPWQAGRVITAADGIHAIDLRTVDKAGNETQYSFDVSVDTVPPVAKITSHSNGAVVAKAVTFSGESSDALSGVSAVQLKTDDPQWIDVDNWSQHFWDDRWVTGYGMNGPHTISLLVKDNAGNTSVDSIRVNVDNGLPLVFVLPTPIPTSTLIPSPTPTFFPTVLPTSTLPIPTAEVSTAPVENGAVPLVATTAPTEQPLRQILGRGVVRSWRLYTVAAGLFAVFGLSLALDRRPGAYRNTAKILLGAMQNNSQQE